jgi:hypothetical protein
MGKTTKHTTDGKKGKRPKTTRVVKTAEPPKEPEFISVNIPTEGLGIHEGQLFSIRENMFFSGAAPIPLASLNVKAITPEWKILAPKIPYSHWCSIVAFHKWCVATFCAETHISHLLTDDGKWIHCPFHQSVTRGAMTIQVDYSTPENLAIFEHLRTTYGVNSGNWHGTTHNHVKASAFASGTDKGDELHKQGVHITVGNCDKEVITVDARIRILIPARFNEDGDKISPPVSELLMVKDWGTILEIPGWDKSLPDAVRIPLAHHWATHTPDNGFPEEWKDYITERPFQTHVRSYNSGGHHGGHSSQGGTTVNPAKAVLMRITKGNVAASTGYNTAKTSVDLPVEQLPTAVEVTQLFEKKDRRFAKVILDLFSHYGVSRYMVIDILKLSAAAITHCANDAGIVEGNMRECHDQLRKGGHLQLTTVASQEAQLYQLSSTIVGACHKLVAQGREKGYLVKLLGELGELVKIGTNGTPTYQTDENFLNHRNLNLVLTYLNTLPDHVA